MHKLRSKQKVGGSKSEIRFANAFVTGVCNTGGYTQVYDLHKECIECNGDLPLTALCVHM